MEIDPTVMATVRTKMSDPAIVFPCRWKGKSSAVAMNTNRVLLVSGTGVGKRISAAPIGACSLQDLGDGNHEIMLYGTPFTITFPSSGDAEQLESQLNSRKQILDANRGLAMAASLSTPGPVGSAGQIATDARPTPSRKSVDGLSTALLVIGILTIVIGVIAGIIIGATLGTADANGYSTGQHPDAGLGVGMAIGSLAYGLLLIVVGRIGQTVASINTAVHARP